MKLMHSLVLVPQYVAAGKVSSVYWFNMHPIPKITQYKCTNTANSGIVGLFKAFDIIKLVMSDINKMLSSPPRSLYAPDLKLLQFKLFHPRQRLYYIDEGILQFTGSAFPRWSDPDLF